MASIQIDLPTGLVERISEKLASRESLNKVVTEAIEMWLEKQEEQAAPREKALQVLRDAGLVMSPEAQRSMAAALMVGLPPPEQVDRSEVEAALANLKVPLSDEILLMRGER